MYYYIFFCKSIVLLLTGDGQMSTQSLDQSLIEKISSSVLNVQTVREIILLAVESGLFLIFTQIVIIIRCMLAVMRQRGATYPAGHTKNANI